MESLGKFLRKERETRNISLEEVSKFTKIKQHHLKAIEEGRCELLPPTPYVKGYLNIYARYLTLDPKNILLRYEEYLKSLIPPESIELQHHALSKKKRQTMVFLVLHLFVANLLGLISVSLPSHLISFHSSSPGLTTL